jgi:hypothetical protein
MKRILTALVSIGVLLGALAVRAQQPAPAPEGQPVVGPENFGLSVDAAVDFASKYVWRGMLRSDGAVCQPTVNVAFANLAGGTIALKWSGNLEMNDTRGKENEFTEYETGLSYSREDIRINELATNLEIGLIDYRYPRNSSRLYYAAPTNILKYEGQIPRKDIGYFTTPANWDDRALDAYAVLGLVVIDTPVLRLQPFVSSYYECDDINGWYFRGGITADIPLVQDRKWSLQLTTAVGDGSGAYNNAFFDAQKNALSDLFLGAKITGKVDQHITTSIGVSYSDIIDSKLDKNANLNYGDSEMLWVTWGLEGRF